MDNWYKFFTIINVFLYNLSNGHAGSKLGKQSILLLHSQGRKTGKTRLTTLSYYRDGDNYLVVASNWGKESHPGWYYNLLDRPHTTIKVGTKTIPVEAHRAEGEEYQRLWKLAIQKNKQYTKYQNEMKRHLPIVVLVPTSQT